VGRIVTLVVVGLIGGSLWYGHAPPRSEGAYRRQAASTVELLASQVGTARLWIDAVRAGRVTRPAASVAFREAEDDARSTTARFAGYDPPAGTAVRDQVTAAAGDTVDALAAVRIAAHDGRWQHLGDLDGRLEQVTSRLTDLDRALR
jgi:hypothetical protein